MIYFDTGDLAGRTFLMQEDDDGLGYRARIIEVLDDHERNVANNPILKKFKCLVGEDKFEEILSYNKVMQHIEKDDDDDGGTFWKYKPISGHEGPLNKNHSSWKGDTYNVKVKWENGEVSYEPLHTIAADDPVACAIYAKDYGLLDTEGWKRFGSLAKRAKKMLRMVNQSKLRSYKTCKKYMCTVSKSLEVMMMPSGSTSFTATTRDRVQPSWRWINFMSTILSMTKV
jgi:hypothetical protein